MIIVIIFPIKLSSYMNTNNIYNKQNHFDKKNGINFKIVSDRILPTSKRHENKDEWEPLGKDSTRKKENSTPEGAYSELSSLMF